jgi:hypothetical protein
VTLRQQLYMLGMNKLRSCEKDGHMDRSLTQWKHVLPKPNSHPASFHMLKRILDVPDAEDFEQHVCVSDCDLFPKLQPGMSLIWCTQWEFGEGFVCGC